MRGCGDICSLAVSQDGRWIVSGDRGEKATVWNAATHEKVREFEHESPVWAVDISSDCSKFVTGSWDYCENVRLFDLPSGTELLPTLAHREVDGVKFSPDNSRLATVSDDSGVRVHCIQDGNVLFDSGDRGSTNSSSFVVTPLAWSSDGQQLFVARKGRITCFDVSDSSSSEWSIHETRSPVSISSNGRFIACSAGKSVSLWDCVSREKIRGTITHTAGINCIALSPSGRYLACGDDYKITIHNLRDVLPMKYLVRGFPLVQVSGETLASWTQGSPTNTEMLLSEEFASTSSPSHHLLKDRTPSIRGQPRASRLPLVRVSGGTFKSWTQGDPTNAETSSSEETASTSSYSHHLPKNRAPLIRGQPRASRPPLVRVSGRTFKSWTQGDPTETETLLSEEIAGTSSPSHYLLANRALIRAHLDHVALATEDAMESLRVQPSPIGYIAMAVALLGQDDGEGALRIFDLAFHDCELDEIRPLLLLKSILIFECGNQEDAIKRVELLATRANDDNDDDSIYLYTQVLGVMYMQRGDYGRAIPLIEHAENLAPKDVQCLPLMTISLIFGWSFNRLDIVTLCETLYFEGRTAEAVEILNIMRSDEETQGHKATTDWVAGTSCSHWSG
ncbi:hypothetical protein EDD16DRAFT_1075436 [Pisolithus croceorrhizus]|nr:hypothetical protein EDD16DRAFT_1075436 [Pisolithus croceorrhizus]